MESTKPEEKQDEGKITGKGCLGCLGIGAGILLLLAFLGSLLPDDLDFPAQETASEQSPSPTATTQPEVEPSPPPAPPQPDNEQLDEAARAEVTQMILDLGEIYDRQKDFWELANSRLESNCNLQSLNEDTCQVLLGSALSIAQGVVYVNQISRDRIRAYQRQGRDLGPDVSDALATLQKQDAASREMEAGILELARQVELESVVRTLGGAHRDAPMFRSFALRWRN
ncbi:MAG: hypothetical protein F4210_13935 [Holophagales bacterium]|nr:hypothetical protein [Holophagales bacterium]MYF96581.1 hypothetical protein [Holophagales bacterium]